MVNVADFVSVKLQNSKNYKSWREQMLRFMESQGFAGLPPPPPPPTEVQHYAAWRRTDSVLKVWLLESVSSEVARTVANSGTAYDMWLHLENFCHHSKGKEWHEYLPLYKAAVRGDWETAKDILEHDPGAVDAQVAFTLETALHVAVSSGTSDSFVARLVERMSDKALAIADSIGFNALHTAALTGNLPAAEILTHRLPDLLYEPCIAGRFPVHWAADVHGAADFAHRQTLKFFISQTRDDQRNNPFTSHNGLLLLRFMIDADYFDMALDLVEKYPELARLNSVHGSALTWIATKDTAFSIDAHFNWWERLIYNSLPQQQRIPTLCNLIKGLVPRVKGIHEKKLNRGLALKLVKSLCKHMESLSYEEAAEIYRVPFLEAARLGIHEIIEEVVDTFPTAIYATHNATRQNFIHLAVENRCERVFNLMYQTGNRRYHYANISDSSGNSILHLAAALAPSHKLNLVSGAALQMQREIQWFKEADKFVSPYNRGQNKVGQTPKMIFTEQHKQLKEEGEKWMKDTANSCTIAAALIVTIVFAAAITVPGGNDSDSGFPMMWESNAFTIFAVSDAISLFTSTTSLLMFLSILTSRYAEEDFLYALPKRLCIGLVTLFLSILFMMVAFGSTLYLVFGRMHTWILMPVVALSLLPITSFVLLQFPLLIDVVSSTYGRGIFGKQSHRRFY